MNKFLKILFFFLICLSFQQCQQFEDWLNNRRKQEVAPCFNCQTINQSKQVCPNNDNVETRSLVLRFRGDALDYLTILPSDKNKKCDINKDGFLSLTEREKCMQLGSINPDDVRLQPKHVAQLTELLLIDRFWLPGVNLTVDDFKIEKMCDCEWIEVTINDPDVDINTNIAQSSSSARKESDDIISVAYNNPRIMLPKIEGYTYGKKPFAVPPPIPSSENSITVAIIDSGIDLDAFRVERLWLNNNELRSNEDMQGDLLSTEDLAGQMIPQPGKNCLSYDLLGYDFYHDDPFPQDEHGHGSHLASIIAKAANTTSGLKIMPLQVGGFNKDTDEFELDLFSIKCALSYAIKQNVNIINMSFGYYSSLKVDEQLRSLFTQATTAGILIVTSAGNEGVNTSDECKHWPSEMNQQFSDNVINVGAYDNSNRNCKQLASMSNYGSHLDIVTAGVDIPGASQTPMSGTSVSAAFVTMYAAMLLGENPNLTPTELKTLILSSPHSHNLPNECRGAVRHLNIPSDVSTGNETASLRGS